MSKIKRERVRLFQLGSDLFVAEIITQNDKRAVIRYPLLAVRGQKNGIRLITPFWYEISDSEVFVINHWSLRHVIQTRPNNFLLDVYENLANKRVVKKGSNLLKELPTTGTKPELKLLKFKNKDKPECT